MRALDLAIIAIFLVGMPLLGIWIGGRQKSGSDYFVGEGKIRWWVACLSVVSAETSTLTVLSVPTVAYLATPGEGGMTYLALAIGCERPEARRARELTAIVPPEVLGHEGSPQALGTPVPKSGAAAV